MMLCEMFNQCITSSKCLRAVITLDITMIVSNFHMIYQLDLGVCLIITVLTVQPWKPFHLRLQCLLCPGRVYSSLPLAMSSLESWLLLLAVSTNTTLLLM